jgi:hypothetical protein
MVVERVSRYEDIPPISSILVSLFEAISKRYGFVSYFLKGKGRNNGLEKRPGLAR